MEGIDCIFFSEFHPITGPKITYQDPADYISKETFDVISVYIIAKPQLDQRLIRLNLNEVAIMSLPCCIQNKKYSRNELRFNLGLMLPAKHHGGLDNYEPVIKKLANYMVTLELESQFLSDEVKKEKLSELLPRIRQELNMKGSCMIRIDIANTIFLNIKPALQLKRLVDEILLHHAPIMLDRVNFVKENISEDLIFGKMIDNIVKQIDGRGPVKFIADNMRMEYCVFRTCLEHLQNYEVTTTVPTVKPHSCYRVADGIYKLLSDKKIYDEPIYSANEIDFYDLLIIMCEMTEEVNVRDLCVRHNNVTVCRHMGKFVQCAEMGSYIRHLDEFIISPVDPISVGKEAKASDPNQNFGYQLHLLR